MPTQADRRARQVINGLRTLAQDERDRRRSPTSLRLEGALFAYIGPRLAHDEEMPDLEPAVGDVTRDNIRARRKVVADRIRKAVRGRLSARDDMDDLEELLEALEEEESESEDHTVEAEFGRGGRPEDVTEDPWPEARDGESDVLARVKAMLEGHVDPDVLAKIDEVADSRHRRATATDAPDPFPGMPIPGRTMVPQPHEDHNDTRFPRHGRPADARDSHPRHAYDARSRGFLDRFRFTKNTRADDGTGRPMLSE